MIHPIDALLVSGIIFLLAVFLFIPRYGIISRIRRARLGIHRIMIEDALKHLFDCESRKITCTTQSIAGTLLISADHAAKVIARLGEMKLLINTGKSIELTAEGRSYALRVIRIHRLWEQYLADQTSVPETEWHASAELQEHTMTHDETEELAARIGNPQYDPHGDPIPSSSGEIPPAKGQSLLTLKSGAIAKITHIEDEPEAVFAQIVAEGLFIGKKIFMIEQTNERIRFSSDGDEIILAPIVAANITVEPLADEEHIAQPIQTLLSLRQGESANVLGISHACRGQQRRRLLDLGVVPGTIIKHEFESAAGDPIAYNIRGAMIALRRQHANQIFIQKN